MMIIHTAFIKAYIQGPLAYLGPGLLVANCANNSAQFIMSAFFLTKRQESKHLNI
jgi:hypothetical protein